MHQLLKAETQNTPILRQDCLTLNNKKRTIYKKRRNILGGGEGVSEIPIEGRSLINQDQISDVFHGRPPNAMHPAHLQTFLAGSELVAATLCARLTKNLHAVCQLRKRFFCPILKVYSLS